jgi:hypothetical protein
MGYMIEISDSKLDKMGEYVEEMLWAGGELMHCLEKMKGGSGWGERGGYGNRGGQGGRYSGGSSSYGSRGGMNYRDDEDWEEMDERDDEMMERRGGRRRRDSRGRYM